MSAAPVLVTAICYDITHPSPIPRHSPCF
jgi:hypothetical protein